MGAAVWCWRPAEAASAVQREKSWGAILYAWTEIGLEPSDSVAFVRDAGSTPQETTTDLGVSAHTNESVALVRLIG